MKLATVVRRLGSIAILVVFSPTVSSVYANPASRATGSSSSSQECCRALRKLLSSKIAYPKDEAYSKSVSSYWAQGEQSISPSCIVVASETKDVAISLGALIPRSCKFAVRSGGHGSAPGVANIERGVTLDLSGIAFIHPNQDNSLVSVGPGQEWSQVYETLAPLGVSIPGTRAGGVGVAGSTLGGGLGFIAPTAGFAADNVAEYEVVLANASIVTASKTINSDLFKALKGGGSNLGIVTKFVFHTVPLGRVWGGDSLYPATSLKSAAVAFSNFLSDAEYDEKAQALMTFIYIPTGPQIVNQHIYAAPVESPPAFARFAAIENQILNTTSVTDVHSLSVGAQARSPDGLQQLNFAISIENDAQAIYDTWSTFEKTFPLVAKIQDISWALTFVALNKVVEKRSEKKGGNVLGINVPPSGLVLVFLSGTFKQASDYPAMSVIADNLRLDLIAQAKKKGVYHPYIDLNHASPRQGNVFAGYGSKNHKFLKSTAKKYDPTKVFQKLMPGGFKL